MSAEDLKNFAAVILAAGQSKRMGQTNKLLQEISGCPIVAHVFKTVASLRLGERIVVTGQDRVSIEDLAQDHGLRTIQNPNFEKGMGTSTSAGVRALSRKYEGIFIHLGDIPFVNAKTFEALASVMLRHSKPSAQIFAPVFHGKRGHPVLFSGALERDLVALKGDAGGKALLQTHSVSETPVEDPFIHRDVDTKLDLQKLRHDVGDTAS